MAGVVFLAAILACQARERMPDPDLRQAPKRTFIGILSSNGLYSNYFDIGPPPPARGSDPKERAKVAMSYARRGEKRFNGKDFRESVDRDEAFAVMLGNYYHIAYDYPGTPEAAVAWQKMRLYRAHLRDDGLLLITPR